MLYNSFDNQQLLVPIYAGFSGAFANFTGTIDVLARTAVACLKLVSIDVFPIEIHLSKEAAWPTCTNIAPANSRTASLGSIAPESAESGSPSLYVSMTEKYDFSRLFIQRGGFKAGRIHPLLHDYNVGFPYDPNPSTCTSFRNHAEDRLNFMSCLRIGLCKSSASERNTIIGMADHSAQRKSRSIRGSLDSDAPPSRTRLPVLRRL